MRTWLKHSLWLLPFLCFTLGYWLPYLFFTVGTTTVPHLLGKSLQTSLELTSSHNLSLKLLRTQEDPTLPAGTVLFQTPSSGRSIRPHQTILIIASCLPPQQKAPACKGLTLKDATALLKKEGIHPTIVSVPSGTHTANTVVAQKPLAGVPLKQPQLILYVGENKHTQVSVPSLSNLPVYQVHEFLILNGLALVADHECNQDMTTCTCIIQEQKPLAGSFIESKKPPMVYVKAKR